MRLCSCLGSGMAHIHIASSIGENADINESSDAISLDAIVSKELFHGPISSPSCMLAEIRLGFLFRSKPKL